MGGLVLGLAGAALVAATGLATAAVIGIRSLSELVLAAYVVAFAEIVGLTLALSTLGAMSRGGFVLGIVALFLAAGTGWLVAGRPRASGLSPQLRSLVNDPPLSVLATAVGLALAYLAALIVATPPNSSDSLSYHLPRAALWVQAGHVGYVENAYDARINANPPNAEIALAFVIDLTRGERFAGFVQLAAALACAVGVFGLARRLRLAEREAAFGALLFLTLPVVLAQAPTTQNDLVAASMFVAAAVFLTGTSSRELGLASLATALAVGTKVPAVFGLPLLLALAIVAPRRHRLIARLVALTVGAGMGAYWYVVNIRNSGQLFGPLSGSGETTGEGLIRTPQQAVLTAFGLVVDSFDLSGSRGADIFVYVVAAALVAAFVGVLSQRRSGYCIRVAVLAGALALLPLVLYPGSYAAWRAWAKLHYIFSGGRWFAVRGWDPTRVGENFSWFGPVGFFLFLGVGAATVVLVRRRTLPLRALLYAGAPLMWLALVVLILEYNPWHGRLFIFPVALCAALWGIALRAQAVSWATVAVAVATTVLVLVNNQSKPSGLRLLEPDPPASVWTMKRWEVQSIQHLDVRTSLRFVEERIPRAAHVALALSDGDFGYPPFGPTLARTVELAAPGSNGRDVLDADWLLVSLARGGRIDGRCWRRADVGELWVIFERRPRSCSS